MGQRDRQPAASARSSPPRARRYTWAREQPREPADAVRQRPGDRPDGRGASSCATTRRGDVWCADARARCRAPRRAAAAWSATRRASRASRTPPHGIAHELDGLRRRRRAGEALAAHARRTDRRAAAAQRLRLQRVGARARRAPASTCTSSPSCDAGDRRGARAQPLQPGVPGPRRLRRRQRAAALRHRRPRRVPRPQRLARGGRRRCGATALAGRFGAGLDPAPRCRSRVDARAGRDARGRVRCSARATIAAHALRPDRAPRVGRRRPSARSRAVERGWDALLGHGRRCRRPTTRSTC